MRLTKREINILHVIGGHDGIAPKDIAFDICMVRNSNRVSHQLKKFLSLTFVERKIIAPGVIHYFLTESGRNILKQECVNFDKPVEPTSQTINTGVVVPVTSENAEQQG